MSDQQDQSQKTEDPSEYKLQEARKKGDVFSSREVNAFASFLTFLMLASWLAPWSAHNISLLLKSIVSEAAHNMDISQMRTLILPQIGKTFLYALPILIAFLFSDLLSSLAQIGIIFSTKALKFDISKVSPIAGFKRIFSLNSIVEAGKGIAKIVMVGSGIYFTIKPKLNHIFGSSSIAPYSIPGILTQLVIQTISTVCIIMFFVAVFDFYYQRKKYMDKMKMSKQDVKDENKKREGNPEIKSRLRSIRIQKARQLMANATQNATLVITNPTHYAVALLYDEATMNAPTVIAKGIDEVALAIKTKAIEKKIPVIENPPLARSLYKEVQINKPIKESHYKIVAKLIAKILSLKQSKAK